MKLYHWILVLCTICIPSLSDAVTLPSIFSDNMVLQQNKVIQVWGWAEKGETVVVKFMTEVQQVRADKNGNWNVFFSGQPYGGPYTMDIQGKNNHIVLNNILIGEVWLCSGQSNMEFALKDANNATEEINKANYYEIRSFTVAKTISNQPKANLQGTWQVCSPKTAPNFSAVGYFFALNLYQKLGIPIGIINASWGGTDIETWISGESFNRLSPQFTARYNGTKIENFDQFLKQNSDQKRDYLRAMSNDPGMSQQWYAPATNTSSWMKMKVPQLWENNLGNIDGIVWYSRTINLSREEAGKKAFVQLGPIDDNDEAWINGKPIGHTEGYSINRQYSVPENTLVEGNNVITVKVVDNGGGGGFYGKAEDMYLDVSGQKHLLAGEWNYKESVTNKQYNYVDPSPNMLPSLLYNTMINPITKLPIAGVIWYQGENNVSKAYNYKTLFPTLIKDWRQQFNANLPFYWVQLANFLSKESLPVESAWAELREAQNQTLALPNTGQAVITDIGDADDIHPRNKQDVGLRLALLALNKTYGDKLLVSSGPTFRNMTIKNSQAIISFNNVGGGLVSTKKIGSDKKAYVDGFAIAGKDKQFVWAKAYIEDGKVIVYSEKVTEPVAVRYDWANNPDVGLYNKEGLPAAPFKTDNWKWITE